MRSISFARPFKNPYLPGLSIIDNILGYDEENNRKYSRTRYILYYSVVSPLLLTILAFAAGAILIMLSQAINVTGNKSILLIIYLLLGGCALLCLGSFISLRRTSTEQPIDEKEQTVSSKLQPGKNIIILLTATIICIVADIFWLQHASQISLTKSYPMPIINILPQSQARTYTMETPVRFTATGKGHDLNYSWYFTTRNTEQAQGASVLHTFTEAGQYTITVKATDGIGQSSSQTISIQILPPAPTAYFVARLFNYYYPYQVEFDASNTKINPDIADATYSWNFGDGQQLQNQLVAEAGHRYAHDGKYTVTLTIRDEYGQISTYKTTFVVTKLPPMVHDDD